MNLQELVSAMAELEARAVPPQYILCGRARYTALMKDSGLDPDSPEGEHDLNAARNWAQHSSGESQKVPATSFLGLRVVVSDALPPDFLQVLPDPVFDSYKTKPIGLGKLF